MNIIPPLDGNKTQDGSELSAVGEKPAGSIPAPSTPLPPEASKPTIMKSTSRLVYDLMQRIENLPASPLATELVVMAGVIFSRLAPDAQVDHPDCEHLNPNKADYFHDPSRPPVASFGQWIPVGERLPEQRRGVLVWDVYKNVNAAYRYDGKWHYWSSCNTTLEHRITHWMPLPAAPTDKEKAV